MYGRGSGVPAAAAPNWSSNREEETQRRSPQTSFSGKATGGGAAGKPGGSRDAFLVSPRPPRADRMIDRSVDRSIPRSRREEGSLIAACDILHVCACGARACAFDAALLVGHAIDRSRRSRRRVFALAIARRAVFGRCSSAASRRDGAPGAPGCSSRASSRRSRFVAPLHSFALLFASRRSRFVVARRHDPFCVPACVACWCGRSRSVGPRTKARHYQHVSRLEWRRIRARPLAHHQQCLSTEWRRIRSRPRGTHRQRAAAASGVRSDADPYHASAHPDGASSREHARRAAQPRALLPAPRRDRRLAQPRAPLPRAARRRDAPLAPLRAACSPSSRWLRPSRLFYFRRAAHTSPPGLTERASEAGALVTGEPHDSYFISW